MRIGDVGKCRGGVGKSRIRAATSRRRSGASRPTPLAGITGARGVGTLSKHHPHSTPKSDAQEDVPSKGALHFEGAIEGTGVLIEPQGAQGRMEVRRYLIIEGRAGFGAENGECSASAFPIAEDRLSQVLLRHVEDERMRIDADRNNAHCLGEIPAEEIALTPDRATGLSVWIFGCALDGDPDDFENKSRALNSFLRLREPSPLATFSIESVQAAPGAVAAFLISVGRTPDDGRTTA